MPNEDDELSRREWIATLGSVAAAGLAGGARGDETETSSLPAGLYLPSADHLGHALMNSGRFHPLVPDCPTDYVRPATGPYEPQFFSPDEFQLIRRVTELMLDAAQEQSIVDEIAQWIDLRVSVANDVHGAAKQLNPMHRALAVAFYGSESVEELETSNPKKICREGLAWFHERQFLSRPAAKQVAILNEIEKTEAPFFAFIKAEIIRGFYTSQAGLKELDYKGNAYYGRSPGCDKKNG